jgi:hypothetical protein
MTKTVQGIIHGKTIELTQDLGMADGQEVEVVVTTIPGKERWGEGLRRSAGALANKWSNDDDRILGEIYEDRKRDTRREISE